MNYIYEPPVGKRNEILRCSFGSCLHGLFSGRIQATEEILLFVLGAPKPKRRAYIECGLPTRSLDTHQRSASPSFQSRFVEKNKVLS